MTGAFSPGLYWHKFAGWTIIARASILEYRAARPDGPATMVKLWGHVAHPADLFGKKKYQDHPGIRLSRAAWKDYADLLNPFAIRRA